MNIKYYVKLHVNYQNLYNYNPRNFENDLRPPTCGWFFEGKFTSNYKNRSISKKFQKFIDNPIVKFKEKSISTKMVLIGDGDLIRNDFLKINNQIKPVLLSFESADYGTSDFFLDMATVYFFKI